MMGLCVEEQIEKNDHKEGDPNFLIQIKYNEPLKTDSKYYPNRCTIEIQKDNTAHLHYRDMRLHMTFEECKKMAEMFSEALEKMDNIEEFPYKGILRPIQKKLPIDSVQPYDAGHLPLAEDKDHRQGIEFVKNLIHLKKKIRPILVNDEGQRMDGFKRYMAHKELGIKMIDCIIDPYAKMGGQHGESFEI